MQWWALYTLLIIIVVIICIKLLRYCMERNCQNGKICCATCCYCCCKTNTQDSTTAAASTATENNLNNIYTVSDDHLYNPYIYNAGPSHSDLGFFGNIVKDDNDLPTYDEVMNNNPTPAATQTRDSNAHTDTTVAALPATHLETRTNESQNNVHLDSSA